MVKETWIIERYFAFLKKWFYLVHVIRAYREQGIYREHCDELMEYYEKDMTEFLGAPADDLRAWQEWPTAFGTTDNLPVAASHVLWVKDYVTDNSRKFDELGLDYVEEFEEYVRANAASITTDLISDDVTDMGFSKLRCLTL